MGINRVSQTNKFTIGEKDDVYSKLNIFFQSVSLMVLSTELSILKAKSEYWVPVLTKSLITETLFSYGRNGKKSIHF